MCIDIYIAGISPIKGEVGTHDQTHLSNITITKLHFKHNNKKTRGHVILQVFYFFLPIPFDTFFSGMNCIC
jgi:hypothetical protein